MTAPVKIEGMSMAEFLERTRQRPIKLINGEIIDMSPTIHKHSDVIDYSRELLKAHVKANELGKVYSETTYILADVVGSDWVKGSRVPDVMYVSAAKMEAFYARPDANDIPLTAVPDLVIEVISPNDRYTDVMRDVLSYLADGVKLIWVLDYNEQTIVIHRQSGGQPTLLSAADTITGEDVLPNFKAQVSQFFAE
jgi:Uma2 family endonuclease